MDIFGCENLGVYVKMGVSVIERRNRFRKVKNFSAMHRQVRKMMPVNEVSGYRKFGGCLDAYMDAHLEPNMMETSKQSERTIKIK